MPAFSSLLPDTHTQALRLSCSDAQTVLVSRQTRTYSSRAGVTAVTFFLFNDVHIFFLPLIPAFSPAAIEDQGRLRLGLRGHDGNHSKYKAAKLQPLLSLLLFPWSTARLPHRNNEF